MERRIQEYLRQNEHDACALIATVRKDGQPAHACLTATIDAMVKMTHRSGDVDGEGDGAGVQTDIPRALWAEWLAAAGKEASVVNDHHFAVAHLFIPKKEAYWSKELKQQIIRRLGVDGVQVLLQRTGETTQSALGPSGIQDEPEFLQLACWVPGDDHRQVDSLCFKLELAIESETPVHVVSFASTTVVYKVRGAAMTLPEYFADLRSEQFVTRAVIGHNRYSTNTSTIFERVQPFTLLGHNGEINTIRRHRDQTRMLGIPLTKDGSDSQDVNRLVAGLVYQYGVSLFEAFETAFPPIIGEIKSYRPELQDMYMYLRQVWGPFAQGPAAMAARAGDECVFQVDQMGLRPFWVVETSDTYYFSSEQGVVSAADMVINPKPLAPGEKVGVVFTEAGAELLSYTQIQERVLSGLLKRLPAPDGYRNYVAVGGPAPDHLPQPPVFFAGPAGEEERLLSALGWSGEDLQIIQHIGQTGNEPVGSLGYDGPLAALAEGRHNLADYFKESVAVVTNPAVDREREIEHFSTRVVLGARPPVALRHAAEREALYATRIELRTPILFGGHDVARPDLATYRQSARDAGTYLLEDLLLEFDPLYGAQGDPGVVRVIPLTFRPDESLPAALQRLGALAKAAVREGAQILLLDDSEAFTEDHLWLDPILGLTAIDNALRATSTQGHEPNLRRRCSLILRSGALRSLHDIVVAIGIGADAVNPHRLLVAAAAAADSWEKGLGNIISGLTKGLEKVVSTLGIHELRGYDRNFSTIGLKKELSEFFEVVNYMGSEEAGLGFARLKADAGERYRSARGEGAGGLARVPRIWPKLWKAAGDAATGKAGYESYAAKVAQAEQDQPVSLRHLLDFRKQAKPVDPAEVDVTIEDYRYPLSISGMSFGSQGEVAFRAYAEAAKQLDIVCMNGEGGEIPDMIGRYFKWRGEQIASGRFGVNADMLAGARFLEIKVGQGAKPGEGGHLPGSKVTEKVARARNATTGSDLISPSNNHDVYSIEDLAELVEELRTVNPVAKIVVKIPVVPGIGTIAVGVAKSGADVIALCGYDGGTGAARKHALKHAGLPIEIGVRESHLALVAAGIRDRVELWADSGMKSAADVVKMMLLGANRVGFATLAMVSIGCTICRGCQLDTCHVGIATQMEDLHEAKEKGLKHFVPRVYDEAVQRLVNLFTAVGEDVRRLTAELGFTSAQALVGHAELLHQVHGQGRVDLRELTTAIPWRAAGEVCGGVRKVPNPKTRELALVAAGRIEAGENALTIRTAAQAQDRIMGTYLAGDIARSRFAGKLPADFSVNVEFEPGSVPGNGLAAWNTHGLHLKVEGGAQDGVGKGMLGGSVVVLKTQNRFGGWVNGSVGKSFAYGAQKGLFVVQGDADARFCIRLSGADVIVGGGLKGPIDDSQGAIGTRANLKGFAFEYMTMGRAVVMGDPGPWICSGMTGGVVYQRIQPEMGLDEAAIKRRIAKGAKVYVARIGAKGKKDLQELLGKYHQILLDAGQSDAAADVMGLMFECERHFVSIIPVTQQADPTISTE